MKKRVTFIAAGVFLLVLLGFGWLYPKVFAPNIPKQINSRYCYIPKGATFDEVVYVLKDQIGLKNEKTFRWWAKINALKPRAGRFEITPGMNNLGLVRLLGKGKQAPVQITIHSKRLPEDLASQLKNELEPDSVDFMQVFNDSVFLGSLSSSPASALELVIPNTYEFFWNTTPQQFLTRMKAEQEKFWTTSRKEKAKKLGLSPKEIYILASIVQKESNKEAEQDRIAGVYLNRLNAKGWKLEADPTVIFAWKDWTIRRVLKSHCEIDSPYNTYKYPGLPPGPICMPSIKTIDRTLDAERHEYFYFCAKAGGSGYHNFAKTLEAHQVNARKFHRWLRTEGIR